MAVHRAYFRGQEPGGGGVSDGEAERGAGVEGSGFYGQAGDQAAAGRENRISLRFPNGSRIVGIPGKEATLRGFSAVSLLIIDEASRVDDAVYKALRPMLAVGNGDLWLLSTPFGKRGFFYENWAGGSEDWVRTACRRRSARGLRRVSGGGAAADGGFVVPAGVLCEFIDGRQQMFGRDMVMAALDEEEPIRF